jgi:hypothetical protein
MHLKDWLKGTSPLMVDVTYFLHIMKIRLNVSPLLNSFSTIS